jgi:DNA invertase Pin-like site-specific DNA recombinase
MVFTVLGAVAEMERGLIAERVKAGMKNAKAKGVKMGAPVALDSAEADRLIAAGMSTQDIARELNVSKRTVYRFRALKAA